MKKDNHILGSLTLVATLAAPQLALTQAVHAEEIVSHTHVVEKSNANEVVKPTPTTVAEAEQGINEAQSEIDQATKDIQSIEPVRDAAFTEAFDAEKEASNFLVDRQSAEYETTEAIKELDGIKPALSEAQTEVDQAQANFDAVKSQHADITAEIETQENAVNKAQNDVTTTSHAQNLAATVVANLENSADASALTDAQNEKDQAAQTVVQATNAADAAEKAVTSAENAFATKSNELNAAIADLQKQVDAANNGSSEVKEVKEVKRQIGNKDQEQNFKANKGLERTIYNGERVETIELDDEQKQTFATQGGFRYRPNVDKVNQHVIEYVNELRAQIGVAPVTVTAEAMDIAKQRTAEQIKFGQSTHYSELGLDLIWDNVGGGGYKGIYKYDTTILSDKQLAYRIVQDLFTEYTNAMGQNYGHRSHMLFGNGEFGFSAQVTRNSLGDILYYTMAGTNRHYTQLIPEYKFVTEKLNDKGVLEYRYKGQEVKFLPNIIFSYVTTTTKTVTSNEKDKAITALNEAKANAAATLVALQKDVNTAKTNYQTALAVKQSAETKLANASAKVDQLTTANQKTAETIQKAKDTLAEKTAQLNQAKAILAGEQAKLDALVAKSTPLSDAKATLDAAQTKLSTLSTRQSELEKLVAKHADFIATAETTYQTLVAKAEAKHDEFSKLDKQLKDAKVRLFEARTAYSKLQTEHDRLVALAKQSDDKPLATLPDGSKLVSPGTADGSSQPAGTTPAGGTATSSGTVPAGSTATSSGTSPVDSTATSSGTSLVGGTVTSSSTSPAGNATLSAGATSSVVPGQLDKGPAKNGAGLAVLPHQSQDPSRTSRPTSQSSVAGSQGAASPSANRPQATSTSPALPKTGNQASPLVLIGLVGLAGLGLSQARLRKYRR